MRVNPLRLCNSIIEYSFYALLFFVPFAITSNTFELFEFNKMWLTFGITLLILGAWIAKMIILKRIFIQRTPLDIPIFLFLLSQIFATVHSLDPYVSLWGYYSRFNGGLLSIVTYISLYYALVSNFSVTIPILSHHMKKEKNEPVHLDEKSLYTITTNLLRITFFAGFFVALWGFPSHFGYDPTCFLFRGTLDVSCWTDQFQPKIRIFSTLGQPNWLAAYLSIITPLSLVFTMRAYKERLQKKDNKSMLLILFYATVTLLLFVDLIFTSSRSGFIGLAGGMIAFVGIIVIYSSLKIPVKIVTLLTGFSLFLSWMLYEWNHNQSLLLLVMALLLCLLIELAILFLKSTTLFGTFRFAFCGIILVSLFLSLFLGTPVSPKITEIVMHQQQVPIKTMAGSALETGGTDSGDIRKIVWKGAIDIWRKHPLFGTGVETFAFAYYQFRPAAHNMTSEWDYLYNKAHNEYLNYLSTTGIFGLGTYMIMIFWFFIQFMNGCRKQKQSIPFLLSAALVASYISIAISNFFGFSVVLINMYFFLIPAFVFVLLGMLKESSFTVLPTKINIQQSLQQKNSFFQWLFLFIIVCITGYFEFTLFEYWIADTAYAYGYNLDRSNLYDQANQHLTDAVTLRPSEPTFEDELSVNDALLSREFADQKDATTAAILAKNAIILSNNVLTHHPNNVVFWKTRVRIFYSLSQIDPQYIGLALDAIKQAHKLAPTDARISYNLGILYGQNNEPREAIQTLENTIVLKSDYKDAYYALGLFYREMAVNPQDQVVNLDMEKKAVAAMQYILNHFSKNDPDALKSLKDWGEFATNTP